MRWAVLLLLLCSAPALADEQELPVYPGAVHTRIGNDLDIGGQLYRIAYFTTDDEPGKVAYYFWWHWHHAGYPVTRDGDFEPEGVVSAFYTREGLQRSVIVTRHEGKTLAFAVLTDLWTQAQDKPNPALSRVEGTLFSTDLVSHGDPAASQQRTAVIAHDLDTTRSSVLADLQAKGFQLTHQAEAVDGKKKGYVFELSRGPEQVAMTLMPVDSTMTAMMQSWSGAPHPGPATPPSDVGGAGKGKKK